MQHLSADIRSNTENWVHQQMFLKWLQISPKTIYFKLFLILIETPRILSKQHILSKQLPYFTQCYLDGGIAMKVSVTLGLRTLP